MLVFVGDSIMALASMTGYGRAAYTLPFAEAVWEIRTLNHRHLDIHIRLPDNARFLEMPIRQLCRQKLQRGKVDIFLNIKQQALDGSHQINWSFLDGLMTTYRQINTRYELQGTPDPLALLQWRGIMGSSEDSLESYQAPLLEGFEQALTHLITVRLTEGSHLQQDLHEKLAAIQVIVEKVQSLLPPMLPMLRDKMQDMLKDLMVQCEPARLEQELALLVMRYDVSEEITRLQGHLKAMHTLLASKDAIGRQLEFLLQEMHREANTLGNKGYHQSITQQAMTLKVIIEQMREQSCNLE